MNSSGAVMLRKAVTTGRWNADAPLCRESFIAQIADRLCRNKVPFTFIELTVWLKEEWPLPVQRSQRDATYEEVAGQIHKVVNGLMRENYMASPGTYIYLDIRSVQQRSGCALQDVQRYFAIQGTQIVRHNFANGFGQETAKYWRQAA